MPPRPWNAKPVFYEINAMVWLRRLSERHQRDITLANVPAAEIERLASWRFDAIWLMGVWRRGPATRASALNYRHEYRAALPDLSDADVVGSAYAIHDYTVEPALGGRAGLASFRERLRRFGIKLILDFVPNHVATDHPWTRAHPEYFIRGDADDLKERPQDFFRAKTGAGGELVFAHGRDPYFPAWIDTAQLNAFQPGYRKAAIKTLIDIGEQCDGLRCDMAMLLLNRVFASTWRLDECAIPAREFWLEVLPAVRKARPHLRFIAEAYWDLEPELLAQGFDYAYDKPMYDHLLGCQISAVKERLTAEPGFMRSSLRFIENHDEARAMQNFGPDRQRAAAALICALPGAVLLHQGQLSGWRVKLPVQLQRALREPADPLLLRFYRRLLAETALPIYQRGSWRLVDIGPAHPADESHHKLIAFCWELAEDWRLILVNLSGAWARARHDMADLGRLAGERWLLVDALSETCSRHDGDALLARGLTLEVPPFGAQILRLERERA